MSAIPPCACGGVFEPIQGWRAYYRCAQCGVMGMRQNALTGYRASWRVCRCQRKVEGVQCGRGAVQRLKRAPRWRCQEHREKVG